MARQPRATQVEDVLMRADGMPHVGQIVLPNAIYKEDGGIGRSARREAARARKDPIKSKKPLPPVKGPGKGGRIGAAATQHIVKDLVRNDNLRDEDPREALLRFAADHKDDAPEWTRAWQQTQPKTQFAEGPGSSDEEEEEEQRAQQRKGMLP
jgi:WD repeat-containing protein 70